MVDTKLSNLPTGSAIQAADLFYSAQNSGSVKQPASALADFVGTSRGELVVNTHADAIAARPSADNTLIRTLGYYAAGDGGGALYHRVNSLPLHALCFTAADGTFWSYANLYPNVTGPLSVLQNGAVADGVVTTSFLITGVGTDNTVAIQQCIDAHCYFGAGTSVYFPQGYYRITNTLMCGYGNNLDVNNTVYVTTHLEGTGVDDVVVHPYGNSFIVYDKKSGPAINVQGNRNFRMTKLNVLGHNMNYVLAHALGSSLGTANVDDTIEDNWLDPAITSGDHSPYAGVCIDGYAGTAEADHYDDVVQPAYSGSFSNTAQYSKAHSSRHHFSWCAFRGFQVGYVVQPSNTTSVGDGDFHELYRCHFADCVYAISICSTQCRQVSRINCFYSHLFCIITNNRHGPKVGELTANDVNGSAQGVVTIFKLKSNPPGMVEFYGFYIEGCWRLGDWTSVTGAIDGTDMKLTFRSCYFSFNSHTENHGIPATILASDTVYAGHINFIECFFLIMWGALTLQNVGRMVDCLVWHCNALSPIRVQGSVAWARYANNLTAGGLMVNSLAANRTPTALTTLATVAGVTLATIAHDCLNNDKNMQARIKHDHRLNVDDATDGPGRFRWATDRQLVDRRAGPSLYSNYMVPSAVRHHPGFLVPQQVSSVVMASITSVVLTTVNAWDFQAVWPSQSTVDWYYNGPQPGDVMIDATTNTVFYPYSVNMSTGAFKAVQVNNYKHVITAAGGVTNTVTLPLTASDFNSTLSTLAYMFVGNSRFYTPAYPLFGDVTSGSANIVNVGTAAGDGSALDTYMAAGDYLYVDPNDPQAPFLRASATISSIINAGAPGGTMIMGVTASITRTRVPLSTFIRAGATGVATYHG